MCRHKMSRPELLHEMFGGVHSKLLYMLMHTDGRLQSQTWNTCMYGVTGSLTSLANK